MVKVQGDAILDHLTQINNPQNSELVAYLRKLVNNGVGKENTNTQGKCFSKTIKIFWMTN